MREGRASSALTSCQGALRGLCTSVCPMYRFPDCGGCTDAILLLPTDDASPMTVYCVSSNLCLSVHLPACLLIPPIHDDTSYLLPLLLPCPPTHPPTQPARPPARQPAGPSTRPPARQPAGASFRRRARASSAPWSSSPCTSPSRTGRSSRPP